MGSASAFSASVHMLHAADDIITPWHLFQGFARGGELGLARASQRHFKVIPRLIRGGGLFQTIEPAGSPQGGAQGMYCGMNVKREQSKGRATVNGRLATAQIRAQPAAATSGAPSLAARRTAHPADAVAAPPRDRAARITAGRQRLVGADDAARVGERAHVPPCGTGAAAHGRARLARSGWGLCASDPAARLAHGRGGARGRNGSRHASDPRARQARILRHQLKPPRLPCAPLPAHPQTAGSWGPSTCCRC